MTVRIGNELVGDGPASSVTLAAGWTAVGAPYPAAGWAMQCSQSHAYLCLHATTATAAMVGATVCTLPDQLHPVADCGLTATTLAGSHVGLRVASDGTVSLLTALAGGDELAVSTTFPLI